MKMKDCLFNFIVNSKIFNYQKIYKQIQYFVEVNCKQVNMILLILIIIYF